MWSAGLAGDVAWFQFGAAVVRPDHNGEERVVGEYALHASTEWQWSAPSGFVKADNESASEVVKILTQDDPRVASVELYQTGQVNLQFADGDTLRIQVPDAAEGEAVEYWRLFKPGTLAPHFVVSSDGSQWDEV